MKNKICPFISGVYNENLRDLPLERLVYCKESDCKAWGVVNITYTEKDDEQDKVYKRGCKLIDRPE